jgi:uncharacterized membrane protein
MQTRTHVSVLISTMVNAVIFGIGAITVLSIPTLAASAWFWLPVVIVVSFLVSPFIAWKLAPRLMLRYQRRESLGPTQRHVAQ